MPRKKKAQEVTETTTDTKIDHSDLWFIERIGDNVNAKLGKELTRSSVLYFGVYGPYPDHEQCLLALEKLKTSLEKQVQKAKAIAKAEPDPLPFKPSKIEDSTEVKPPI